MHNCHIQFHELGFTLPIGHSAATIPQFFADFFQLPGIEPGEIRQPKGRNGYLEHYALKSEHGGELVSISCQGNGNLKNTTHIMIHGSALDTGSIDVPDIAKKVIALGGWGTSAHLAFDDFDGVLMWEEIKTCCAYSNYQNRLITRLCKPSKDKKNGGMKENPPVLLTEQGQTLYLGQKGSDTVVVFYNRRGPIRCELRLSNRAQVTDLLLRIASGDEVGPVATGILRHYLTFVENGFRRKDRRPQCHWWLDFLGNSEKLSLSRKRSVKQRSPWYTPPNPVHRMEARLRKEISGNRGVETLAMLHRVTAESGITF